MQYISREEIPTADIDTLIYWFLMQDERCDIAFNEIVNRRGDPTILEKLLPLDDDQVFNTQYQKARDTYLSTIDDPGLIKLVNNPYDIDYYSAYIKENLQSLLFVYGEQTIGRFEFLMNKLQHPTDTRGNIITGLTYIDYNAHPDYIDELVALYIQTTYSELKLSFLRILGNYPASSTARDVVMTAFESDDSQIVREAMRSVSIWPDIDVSFTCNEEIMAALIYYLSSDDRYLFAGAVYELSSGYGECEEVSEILWQLYSEENDCSKHLLILAGLARTLPPEEAVPLLMEEFPEQIDSPCIFDAEAMIIMSLYEIGPPAIDAVPMLEEYIAQGGIFRGEATRAIEEITRE